MCDIFFRMLLIPTQCTCSSPGDAAADQFHPAGAHGHEPREATHSGHHLPVQQEVLWGTQAGENDFD